MEDPARTLRQIAFQLEREGAPTYRVRAFRKAAGTLDELSADELRGHVENGTLQSIPGIGKTIAQVIRQVARGETPDYLANVVADAAPSAGTRTRTLLRGDCHTHSDWSDGGSPPLEMAEAARQLGHGWVALTDHSPRLTVANGLSPERLLAQFELLAKLNDRLAPFRILRGIEVDILDDGSLDQRADLLDELDVVVASVHSSLRMPKAEMTDRMLTAIRDPHTTVLGHCTGRRILGRPRPQSEFDAEKVFTECREQNVAVEINCRPDRMDPPDPLLRLAFDLGCRFSIDSDAHAPGQLDWLDNGCARADELNIPADRIINTRTAEELLAGR